MKMIKKFISLMVIALSLVAYQPAFAEIYDANIGPDTYLDKKSVPQTVLETERGKIYPIKGSFLDGLEYVFKYESSDSSILSILENGYWQAHRPGTVILKIRQNSLHYDHRLLDELTARNIPINPISHAFAYDPYRVTVTVLPIDFVPVYRLYNSVSKEHLYTKDANEKALLSAKKDWHYEGLAFKGHESLEGKPVYRLYHHGIGKHLYTADTNEKDVLQTRGWKYEGIVYHAKGNQPVYRLYLEGLKKHLLTTDENERNVLQSQGWRYEGVAW